MTFLDALKNLGFEEATTAGLTIGIEDILAKSLGSQNHGNVVKATLVALKSLRTRDEIYALLGKRSPDKKAL